MPDNRYDGTRGPEFNSNDQASRVVIGTQISQGHPQQSPVSQQPVALDTATSLKHTKPEQEVRKQQAAGQVIGF